MYSASERKDEAVSHRVYLTEYKEGLNKLNQDKDIHIQYSDIQCETTIMTISQKSTRICASNELIFFRLKI